MVWYDGNGILTCSNGGFHISILQKVEVVSEDKQPVVKNTATSLSNSTSQHRPPMNYDRLSHMSSSLIADENTVDAASEKDLVEHIPLSSPTL